mmetsp:Transcript_20915/g.28163  ORF Transcript_20915/g.28163 Transcript_20915/m.28163 type:complete len:150 (-) Transcript_20915:949-1398(-)
MVAQSERQQEFFEVFVLGMRLLEKLVSIGGLEAIEYLSLVGQVLKGLSVVLIARLRRILTLYIIYAVTVHLVPVLVLLVVAKEVADFKCGNVAQVGVQKGGLGANDGVDLAESLHRPQIGEVDVCGHQIDIPEHEVGVEVDDALHTDVR